MTSDTYTNEKIEKKISVLLVMQNNLKNKIKKLNKEKKSHEKKIINLQKELNRKQYKCQ